MHAVAQLVSLLINVLMLAILIRAILSWFMQVGRDPFTRLLVDITEPLLAPIRQLMSRVIPGMFIDFSPFVAI
ncbi:MAG TPA: YggT family protein, partial [Chloroflexia bacterium]